MFAKQIRIPAIDLATAFTVVVVLLLLPALYVELTGDFPGRVLFYGQEEDSPLAGAFLDAHRWVFVIFETVCNTVANVWAVVKNFFA